MRYKRIRDLREDYDYTQQKMADVLHVSQSTYSDYENDITNIPIEVFIRLADFYHTSVDYLVGRTNRKEEF